MDDFYPIRLPRTHAYALLDREAVREMPGDWPLIPLVPPIIQNDAHRLPALLPLQELTEEQIGDLLENLTEPENGEPLPVAAFFDSDVDLERMRVHWINQLIIRLPGGDKMLMRSYDPRVFQLLQWMYTPEQLKALFGPIRRWTICLDGEWRSLYPPADAGLPGGLIDSQQVAVLARIGTINEVLFALPAHLRTPYETASRAINALLERAELAEHAGLAMEKDRIAFAYYGMTIHSHFDQHPRIQALLRAMPEAEHTLAMAFAGIGEEEWRDIAQTCSPSSGDATAKVAHA